MLIILVDDVARSLSQSEIPLGIPAVLIGAPVLALVFLRATGSERNHG